MGEGGQRMGTGCVGGRVTSRPAACLVAASMVKPCGRDFCRAVTEPSEQRVRFPFLLLVPSLVAWGQIKNKNKKGQAGEQTGRQPGPGDTCTLKTLFLLRYARCVCGVRKRPLGLAPISAPGSINPSGAHPQCQTSAGMHTIPASGGRATYRNTHTLTETTEQDTACAPNDGEGRDDGPAGGGGSAVNAVPCLKPCHAWPGGCREPISHEP